MLATCHHVWSNASLVLHSTSSTVHKNLHVGSVEFLVNHTRSMYLYQLLNSPVDSCPNKIEFALGRRQIAGSMRASSKHRSLQAVVCSTGGMIVLRIRASLIDSRVEDSWP